MIMDDVFTRGYIHTDVLGEQIVRERVVPWKQDVKNYLLIVATLVFCALLFVWSRLEVLQMGYALSRANQIYENLPDDCCERIIFQINSFNERLKSEPSFYEGFFMYVTHTSDSDLGQSDKNRDFLYAGNFHQFASYALLIQRDGFKPLRLHLCVNAT